MHELHNMDKGACELFEKSDNPSTFHHKIDNLTKELETAWNIGLLWK
jgi:hypothetical protein